MLRTVLLLVGFFGIFSLATPIVAAHEVDKEDETKALLHIDPSDAPTNSTPAKFILFFDAGSNIDLYECACTLEVVKDGVVLAEQDLIAVSETISSNPYEFEDAGVYKLKVTGNTAKQSFQLSFDFVVSEPLSEKFFKSKLSLIAIALSAQLVFTIIIYRYIVKKPNQ